MTKNIIIEAIEFFRKNPPDDSSVRDYTLSNLSFVEEFNVTGKSYCGNASADVLEFLPAYFADRAIDAQVFTVTAPPENSTFHHYNLVRIGQSEPLICDLTASQFFTKPLDVFDGRPYFVGTRQELRSHVKKAQENTWQCAQQSFPEEGLRTLWDIDLKSWGRDCKDTDFRQHFWDARKKHPQPCLVTESFYRPFEITWGDVSRLLRKPASLIDTFDIEANIPELTTQRTPPIADIVNHQTYHHLTLADAPRLKLR